MRNIMFISFSPRIRSNGRIALLLIMVLLLAHSPPRYTPLSPMDIPMSNNWSDLPTSRGCFPPLSLVATTIAVAASQNSYPPPTTLATPFPCAIVPTPIITFSVQCLLWPIPFASAPMFFLCTSSSILWGWFLEHLEPIAKLVRYRGNSSSIISQITPASLTRQ